MFGSSGEHITEWIASERPLPIKILKQYLWFSGT
jgi:hypothetical protein